MISFALNVRLDLHGYHFYSRNLPQCFSSSPFLFLFMSKLQVTSASLCSHPFNVLIVLITRDEDKTRPEDVNSLMTDDIRRESFVGF